MKSFVVLGVLPIGCSSGRHSIYLRIISQQSVFCRCRVPAMQCVRSLAAHIREADALGAAVATVQLQLEGKGPEGKIKAPAERVALLGVVSALAGSPATGDPVAKLASAAVDFLSASYKVQPGSPS